MMPPENKRKRLRNGIVEYSLAPQPNVYMNGEVKFRS